MKPRQTTPQENGLAQLFPVRQAGAFFGSRPLHSCISRWRSLSLSRLLLQPEGIAAVWPPAGLFLSAVLLTRRSQRPYLVAALFFADWIAELFAGTPFWISAVYALALAGDAVLGSWLIVRFVGEPVRFKEDAGCLRAFWRSRSSSATA